jgi:5-methylcytosine-specific restriction endonuclease McrA
VGGSHTGEQIERLLLTQKYKCADCRTSIRKSFHKDHIKPIALGGSNDIRNIQLLCPKCNLSKHSKHPIDWARQNGRLL